MGKGEREDIGFLLYTIIEFHKYSHSAILQYDRNDVVLDEIVTIFVTK